MATKRVVKILVVLRTMCLFFCVAAFKASFAAIKAHYPKYFTPYVTMMVATAAHMCWSTARLCFHVASICFNHAPPVPGRNTAMMVTVEWILMLCTFGTGWSTVAVAVYLNKDTNMCSGFLPATICRNYVAAAAFARVAGYLSLAIAVLELWVEGRSHRHHNN